MNEIVLILVVAAVIATVVFRQLRGEALRGKRAVLLPAILIGVGVAGLASLHHVGAVAVACLAASATLALAIGVWQGRLMRLEVRAGGLWGQLPRRGLWTWAALILSRVIVALVAAALGAKAAYSMDAVLLGLGLNRLAQAAVIATRAISAGVPFAPEKDGQVFLAGLLGQPEGPAPAPHAPGPFVADRPVPGRALPTPLNGAQWSHVARRLSQRFGDIG